MNSFLTLQPSLTKTMNKEELNHLEFLENQNPDYVPSFLAYLKKGREGILRRFASSLLREDVFEIFSSSSDLQKIGSVALLNVRELNSHWHKVMKKLENGHLLESITYKMYSLSEGRCLAFPIGNVYGFRRVEIQGDILHIRESDVQIVETASELMEILQDYKKEAGSFSWNHLKRELENGSANLSLSYTYYDRQITEWQHEAASFGALTALHYTEVKQKQNVDFSASLFFEQLCLEGHNLHPGAKTKMGMKSEDIVRYAPEFHQAFSLQFVGIHKNYAQWNELEEGEIVKAYPALKEAAEKQFKKLDLNSADYIVVPVHPWQMKYEIHRIYEEEIDQNIIVPIHSFSVSCQATSSFRTVIPSKRDGKFVFKTAVNSQMTSTVRSISANTANNAVPFTNLIRNVLKRESSMANGFVPVCEIAGYSFKGNDSVKSRNLSAVLRENIDSLLKEGELAIVGSSLYALSPLTNKPIIIELVEQYADTKKEASIMKAGMNFFRDYVQMVLPGFLTFMSKYGIGLEGHLQNSIPVFEKGVPKRFLFRDWGGSRIYRRRLQQQYGDVEFYPGSVIVTDTVEEMQNKVFYTVFQNHLGEIIFQLCKWIGLQEKACWKEVRGVCDNLFQQLEREAPAEWIDLDRTNLYQPLVDHKALTLMRMMPERKGYSYVSVPNPLYTENEEKKGRV